MTNDSRMTFEHLELLLARYKRNYKREFSYMLIDGEGFEIKVLEKNIGKINVVDGRYEFDPPLKQYILPSKNVTEHDLEKWFNAYKDNSF